MENQSKQVGSESRRISRRQIIAGTGIAAAAWAAPSIVRIDVASAAGSAQAPLFVEVKPNVTPHSCVTLSGDMGPIDTGTTTTAPGPTGTTTIGRFGNGAGPGNDMGQRFTTTITGAQPHTAVNITVEICYTNWEGGMNSNTDFMDIQLNDGAGSLFGGQIVPTDFHPGGVDELCKIYTFTGIGHSSSTLVLDVLGGASSNGDDFGIRCVQIEFV